MIFDHGNHELWRQSFWKHPKPTGAYRLAEAVIKDAIETAEGRRPCKKHHREEDLAWIFSNSRDSFGFLSLCEYISLDPEAVRKEVENALHREHKRDNRKVS